MMSPTGRRLPPWCTLLRKEGKTGGPFAKRQKPASPPFQDSSTLPHHTAYSHLPGHRPVQPAAACDSSTGRLANAQPVALPAAPIPPGRSGRDDAAREDRRGQGQCGRVVCVWGGGGDVEGVSGSEGVRRLRKPAQRPGRGRGKQREKAAGPPRHLPSLLSLGPEPAAACPAQQQPLKYGTHAAPSSSYPPCVLRCAQERHARHDPNFHRDSKASHGV